MTSPLRLLRCRKSFNPASLDLSGGWGNTACVRRGKHELPQPLVFRVGGRIVSRLAHKVARDLQLALVGELAQERLERLCGQLRGELVAQSRGFHSHRLRLSLVESA